MVLWGQELPLNAFSILVKALCASSSSIGTIVNLLEKMPKLTNLLDYETLNFLVQALCISKAFSCMGILGAKRSLFLHYLTTMTSMEHKPSNRCMRIIINCLYGDRELGKAMELGQEMKSRGWIYGSIIQNVMVKGLLAQGKLQEAMRFLEGMVQKGLS
ncbi:Pentatricopeptide repeat-containing protein [Camellia lanceoleosa]|uniref:Pentatricopeptide repeat-containing protein n=1 Tax=Camellia lanceoleosa TaxID=1840588 RepID=A0ACC0HA06_9ERIC|nr:Pentatricopeptide repeat-containing protein [Camellia lanceoleosa]